MFKKNFLFAKIHHYPVIKYLILLKTNIENFLRIGKKFLVSQPRWDSENLDLSLSLYEQASLSDACLNSVFLSRSVYPMIHHATFKYLAVFFVPYQWFLQYFSGKICKSRPTIQWWLNKYKFCWCSANSRNEIKYSTKGRRFQRKTPRCGTNYSVT